MLKTFNRRKNFLFCMPAHKGKADKFDITELKGTDNLHDPDFSIKKSQEIAAKIFEAKKCFYVTTGSTTSIFIMLNAVKAFGKKIIIFKNSHKSVYNALKVFNIEPVIIERAEDIDKIDVNKTLGALITYPNYYGNCIDIEKFAKKLKEHNKLLLSDSSHGGHFNENLQLINPNKYCDLCCFSGFKTLNGLTQGSYLLLNNLSLENNVRESFNLIHTTSPSYVILESLESAVLFLEEQKDNTQLINNINKLKNIDGLNFEKNDDIFKIVLNIENLGISGYTAEKFLNSLRVYPEFADFNKVVFIASYYDTAKDFKKLEYSLNMLKSGIFPKEVIIKPEFYFERKLDYLKAVNANFKLTDIKECEGKIAALNLGLYPPAVPIITAGEIITKEFCQYLHATKERFFNILDGKIKTVDTEEKL